MTKPELLALYRLLADDATAPFLSSDTAVNGWITEAEQEGAERALYLRTGAAYNITVLAGQSVYALSNDVIFIDRAKLTGEQSSLRQTTKALLDYKIGNWESKTGTPISFALDNGNLTLYPVPVVNAVLQLDGSRRPIASMETPLHLHESLVYWVLYRHYSRPDADVVDKKAAQDNLRLFTSAFGHKRVASFDVAWKEGHCPAHRLSRLHVTQREG